MQYLKTILNTLIKYLALITQLQQRYEGRYFTAQDFCQLYRSHFRQSQVSDALGVLAELRSKGVLINAPRSEHSFEIDSNIVMILRTLSEQEQLGLSKAVEAELDDLSRVLRRLSKAIDEIDYADIDRFCQRLDQRFVSLQRQLSANEKAIMRIVERAKQQNKRLSLQQRYAEALDAWDEYLTPLLDMLQVGGLFETTVGQIEQQLRGYADNFHYQLFMQQYVERLNNLVYRLLDLRQHMRQSVQNCQRLLEPLYKRYRKNTAISQGASDIIRRIRTQHYRYVQRIVPFAVGEEKIELTDPDIQIQAYIAEVSRYQAPLLDLPQVQQRAPVEQSQPVVFAHVLQQARAALPIEDGLAWLIQQFPQLNTRQLLEFFLRLCQQPDIQVAVLHDSLSYQTQQHRLTLRQRQLKPIETHD